MRDLICHMVDVLGYEVVGTAGDGVEAIERAKTLRPEIILMDIMMPRLNGIDATRAIMEERPTTVIFVSGFLQDEVRERAIAAGAASLVQKPFTLGDLQSALETSTRPAGLPG
jgi:CheY-like chemotaxis protein